MRKSLIGVFLLGLIVGGFPTPANAEVFGFVKLVDGMGLSSQIVISGTSILTTPGVTITHTQDVVCTSKPVFFATVLDCPGVIQFEIELYDGYDRVDISTTRARVQVANVIASPEPKTIQARDIRNSFYFGAFGAYPANDVVGVTDIQDNVTISTSAGNDSITAGSVRGRVSIGAGSGNDVVTLTRQGTDPSIVSVVDGESGNDDLRGVMTGTNRSDILFGGLGADILRDADGTLDALDCGGPATGDNDTDIVFRDLGVDWISANCSRDAFV